MMEDSSGSNDPKTPLREEIEENETRIDMPEHHHHQQQQQQPSQQLPVNAGILNYIRDNWDPSDSENSVNDMAHSPLPSRFKEGKLDIDYEEQPTIDQVKPRFRNSVIGLQRCPNPVHLQFDKINYGVNQVTKTHCGPVGLMCPRLTAREKGWKQILTDITGEVLPGQILAIMGPSGAGKTTLLDVLSNRQRATSGAVTCNGIPLTPALFRAVAAFVHQHDVLIPTLTVKETLKFHADLRLPRNSDGKMSKELRKERVNNILRQLRLSHCAKTLVGDAFVRGISGGEKRRLSIAISLLTEPGLIFLDEPTSGLDAAMAYDVMQSIQDLARSGVAVIFTIHQPRSNIFKMFDKLLLVCKGRIAYYGPANQAIDYFASRGLHCDQFTNPSDFFLDMVVPGESTGQTEEGIQQFLDSYQPPVELSKENPENAQQLLIEATARHRRLRANWFQQFGSLFWRDSLNQLRNPLTLRIKAMQAIVQGLLFGLIFLQLGYNQESRQSRQGCITFFVIAMIFTTIQGVISTVPRERNVFAHERESNLYGVSTYLASKLSTDIPGELIFNFLFCVITYWLVGLNPGVDRFFIFCLLMAINSFCAVALGYWIAVVSPDETVALILTPFICIFQVLFSGAFLNLGNTPAWGIWIPYISITRWVFQALIINEFDGETFTCQPGEQPCITQGSQVIQGYGFGDVPLYGAALCAFGIGIFAIFLAYATLSLKDWLRRR